MQDWSLLIFHCFSDDAHFLILRRRALVHFDSLHFRSSWWILRFSRFACTLNLLRLQFPSALPFAFLHWNILVFVVVIFGGGGGRQRTLRGIRQLSSYQSAAYKINEALTYIGNVSWEQEQLQRI